MLTSKPTDESPLPPDIPSRRTSKVLARHMKRVFVTLFPNAGDEFPLVFRRACGPTPGLPSVIAEAQCPVEACIRRGS